ncbi:MAG: alanine racemase, partial [Lachnospiraceae bacterium]|nr:alanine racemase [Lachnospiraceae bacterium]
MNDQNQRVCAYVDLDAMLANVRAMKANIAEKTKIIAVIKTNGYGHGAIPIAEELEKEACIFGYAVATAEEAFSLRDAGMKKPILILGYVFPEHYERLIREDVRMALFRKDQAEQISETAKRLGKKAIAHIKVDTAMSRIGIFPDDEGMEFVRMVISDLDGIETEGVFTHFAKADEADKSAVNAQYALYTDFCDRIRAEFPGRVKYYHASNSAGIIELPQANLDLVRAGITLYGLWPSDEVRQDIVPLKPLLSLKSHVVYVKTIPAGRSVSYGGTYTATEDRRIATIPVGYGDGYPRSLSSKGSVLIGGRRSPIVGRVCMDQFMVDVTDLEDVKCGDEVTLIGRDGADEITMEELGDLSGRFNYELACDINARVPRV